MLLEFPRLLRGFYRGEVRRVVSSLPLDRDDAGVLFVNQPFNLVVDFVALQHC